jgi:glycosyltransferase involved in cell wall biosynthesis
MEQNKPTLLLVITQGDPWGGAQKYVADLATALSDRFLVVVAVGEASGSDDLRRALAQNSEIDVVQLRHLKRAISPMSDIMAVLELRRWYKKLRPAIVHLNSSKAGVIGSLAHRLSSSPRQRHLVYTVHGWVFLEPMNRVKKFLYRALERITASEKSRIIVLSPREESVGRTVLNIPPHKLAVIPPGIDRRPELMTRHDARALLRQTIAAEIPDDAFWIGAIANFYPTKGLDILLEAFAAERARMPQAHIVIIGDGPERPALERAIQSLHLADTAHLAGFLPDAPRYLKAFDLFVLPSRKEGLPYVLLEAKLHGIPILATDVGGVSSVIEDGKTGRIVPAEHIGALGSALSALASDAALRERLASAGMADGSAERFSRERMIEDTTALYLSLIREEE